jgi:hypothetical protein
MLAATVKKMSAMTSTQTSNQAAARPIAAFLKPQDFSARTAYRPPAAYYRRINTPLGVLLTSVGFAPRDAVTLEVRGRTSGKVRRTPVLRTRCRGDDYLVSLAGESQWVRNVRAADGRAAGPKPAGRARRAWLIMIAPVAEVLTSPPVFGMLRRRLASGRATASCGPGWPGAGFSRCGLSGHVLWLRRSEHLAAAGPGGSRSAWRRWRDPRAGALAAAGLGPLGDADATEIAISVAVATVNSAAEELLWRGVFPHPEVSRVPSGDG